MFVGLLRFFGRVILSLTMLAFIVMWSLFLVGAYLTTWPILRKSPRDAKIAATTELARAFMSFVQVMNFGGGSDSTAKQESGSDFYDDALILTRVNEQWTNPSN